MGELSQSNTNNVIGFEPPKQCIAFVKTNNHGGIKVNPITNVTT